jgi:hypothetical protein
MDGGLLLYTVGEKLEINRSHYGGYATCTERECRTWPLDFDAISTSKIWCAMAASMSIVSYCRYITITICGNNIARVRL